MSQPESCSSRRGRSDLKHPMSTSEWERLLAFRKRSMAQPPANHQGTDARARRADASSGLGLHQFSSMLPDLANSERFADDEQEGADGSRGHRSVRPRNGVLSEPGAAGGRGSAARAMGISAFRWARIGGAWASAEAFSEEGGASVAETHGTNGTAVASDPCRRWIRAHLRVVGHARASTCARFRHEASARGGPRAAGRSRGMRSRTPLQRGQRSTSRPVSSRRSSCQVRAGGRSAG
jgi:hypothetical protein